jgi:hypothetical protein
MRIGIGLTAGLLAIAVAVSPASAQLMVRYNQGLPTYISVQPSSVVQIGMAPPKGGKQQDIAVIVLNRGGQAASIGYENISLRNSAGASVNFLDYAELQHKARVKAGWKMFGAALVAGLSYYAAAESGYGHYNGYSYTSTRYGGFATSFSGSYYSPVAAQIGYARADVPTGAMLTSISGQLDQTMAKLDGTVLRTTTVDPGGSFGGVVVFELPKDTNINDLTATVTYNGDTHVIPLNGAGAAQTTPPDLRAAAPAPVQATAVAASAGPVVGGPAASAPGAQPHQNDASALIPVNATPTAAPPPPATHQQRPCGLSVATDPGPNLCGAN